MESLKLQSTAELGAVSVFFLLSVNVWNSFASSAYEMPGTIYRRSKTLWLMTITLFIQVVDSQTVLTVLIHKFYVVFCNGISILQFAKRIPKSSRNYTQILHERKAEKWSAWKQRISRVKADWAVLMKSSYPCLLWYGLQFFVFVMVQTLITCSHTFFL